MKETEVTAHMAMRFLSDGDESGFLAVLDHLAGSDYARIERAEKELMDILKHQQRPMIIQVEKP